jgi:hypothetical protein
MKRILKEQLERIHRLNYGNKVISEGFIDDLLSGVKKVAKTFDDPKKADLVGKTDQGVKLTSDSLVDDFNKTLDESISSGGLRQQSRGSMTYQKGVETMQIALILIGYELPAYGVDGLFGPETASTVKKFKLDNQIKSEVSDTEFASPEMLSKLKELITQRGVSSEDIKKYMDPIYSGGSAEFTDLDLTTTEGYETYVKICDAFIQKKSPNPLGITGTMMANAAKNAFLRYRKFVPAELALAQLVVEGGIGNKNPNIRPIRTRNPFNVGNVDSGENITHTSVQNGIDAYYNLIAKSYLGGGRSAKDLVSNFVNKNDNRYASSEKYELMVSSVAREANRVAKSLESGEYSTESK